MADGSAAPRPVRAAGVLVGLQGVAGVVVAVGLLVTAVRGSAGLTLTLGTAGWFAGSGVVLLAVGVNLARGRHGARTPAVVAQILLLGVAWYAAGPSSQPAYGLPAALFCVTVLGLLLCPPAVRWATGQDGTTG
ncbi:MAG: hypothetical protein ABR608_03380 [Pseudonocardiaceae bacterium]